MTDPCFFCGDPSTSQVFIDRVIPICPECLRMKGELGQGQFLSHIQKIASHALKMKPAKKMRP